MKTITIADIQLLKAEIHIQKMTLLETTIKSLGYLENREFKELHNDCIKALEMIHNDSLEFEQLSINRALSHLRSIPLLNDRILEIEQYRLAKRTLEILKQRLES